MWQFRKDDQHHKWYWKEVDEMGQLLRRSATFFRERIDCVVHAMRHGYVHPRQRALASKPLQLRASRAQQTQAPFDAAARTYRADLFTTSKGRVKRPGNG